MSEPSEGSTLGVLQGVVQAIHGHTVATASMTEALVDDQAEARREADRRFNKQARKLRVQSWVLVAVLVLLGWVILQNSQEAARREERSRVAEAQRSCAATIQSATLARLSNLATATPNRVNGSGSSIDSTAMARLRGDVALSLAGPTPDPQLLARIRDEVAQILAAIQPDSVESTRLREEVARANDALLHVGEICFTDHPSGDPLSGKPGG